MNDMANLVAHKAYNMRVSSIIATTAAGSGHPTSCLSAADLVAGIFFYAMRFDPDNPDNPNNDRFILSKGHAAPLLYAAWKEVGVLTDDDMRSLRKFGSVLEGHPTPRFERSEAATGSLGQGLSIGAGMALSAKLDELSFNTYVLMGDSELSEGSVWEAAELAAYYKLDNLIAVADINRLGQSTPTMEEYDLSAYAHKFESFGWRAITIDGHCISDILEALDQAQETQNKPTIIIARTIKGYGIGHVEDRMGFHGKAFKADDLPDIMEELQERFVDDVAYNGPAWEPIIPEDASVISSSDKYTLPEEPFDSGEPLATRKAYGVALAALGKVCASVVSLDAEVKNSTYAQTFEKDFPERFIQCFIAEQNMVGMGVGLAGRNHIPFISTFACFFTRAFDQIRMAAIGQAPLRLVGSHAGVSIGADGPSQMGLEDIAMMRAVPESVVLYPADAVSTYKLVEQMANYHTGISYLRTTRMDTPIIYSHNERFPIGGCKIVRQSDHDCACIIAAGITLFEALKAHEQLRKEGISVAVVDLYSIKPLDEQTIRHVGKASGGRIITVEDHYIQGGLGEAVCHALRNDNMTIDCLAVTTIPRSGRPDELLAYHGIDEAAIIQKVKQD